MQKDNICLEMEISESGLYGSEKHFNSLALWVLEVCYGQKEPSSFEILRVKNELKKIYAYEGIEF